MMDRACWRAAWAIGACLVLAIAVPALAGGVQWDTKALSIPPATRPADGGREADVTAIYYDGLPWKGKHTRIFAYVGVPATQPAGKVPAMVLVHGGGGTAFARWVRLWNQHGYAAIAMDLCGKQPDADGKLVRTDTSGPPGWDDSFGQVDLPIEDQWVYHAIADVMLAHSLLRAMPQVDAERVGITGISWGGYLTSIAAGVDDRFRFAVPVYGCGFLAQDSVWSARFDKDGEAANKWLNHWDPSHYLFAAKMPMLWVSGNVDFAYGLPCLQQSYRLPRGPRHLAIRPSMPHSHPAGEVPAEIFAFADQICRGGMPLAQCTDQGIDAGKAWATFRHAAAIVKAQCVYTADGGPWVKRKWTASDAAWDEKAGRATFELPAGVTTYYLNVTDERGLVSSSEHVVLP